MEFGADPAALAEVVRRARAATRRPLFVKLSPTLPDIARQRRHRGRRGRRCAHAREHHPRPRDRRAQRRRPALGFGTGGVSGAALLPVGVLATWKVRRAVTVPLLGIGGVSSAEDALQYIVAGASLVGIGHGDAARPARAGADGRAISPAGAERTA